MSSQGFSTAVLTFWCCCVCFDLGHALTGGFYTAGTGPCTSCPCSAATTLARSFRKSATLQGPSLTHTSGSSPLTQSARCRCPHCWSTVPPTPTRSSQLRVAPSKWKPHVTGLSCRLSAVSNSLLVVQRYMHHVLVLGCSGVHWYGHAWLRPAIFRRRQPRILSQY